MAYAPPSLGPAGLTLPSYSAVLDDLLAQYRNIYGQNVYLGVDASDYQWISVVAAKIADTMQALQLAYNARSPLTAIGADLDSLVKLNGIARKTASYSSVSLTVSGTPGAVIAGGVAKDVNGLLWNLPSPVMIGAGGTVTVSAWAAQPGNVNAAAGQISLIATPTAGWIAVSNPAPAIAGQPVENDSQLRARQSLSVALPSKTMLAGTIGAIAATPNVTRYNVIENPTGAADSYGTPAHSITCVVEGGADAAVAAAIYNNRGIGCYTNGSTTVTVANPTTGSTMPISFSRPAYVPVYITLDVHGLSGFTSAVLTGIQNAIVNYLNSLQIGELVVMSEIYGAALTARLDPDSPLFSLRNLKLGTGPNPAGTADLAMNYNQVAQGSAANVVLASV